MPDTFSHLNEEYFFDLEGCYITEFSNTPADPAVSIAQARVIKGAATAWHKLSNTTERYCILSGTGDVEIGDNPPRTVSKGEVVIIQPMEWQRITNTGSEDLIFLAICTPRFELKNYHHAENS